MSVLGGFTEKLGKNQIARTVSSIQPGLFIAIRFVDQSRFLGRPQLYFALRRHSFRPIERVMGQQHRVRVKRRRRIAYLDRKKVAAKAAPVRREAPKTKAKPKKQVASTPET
jgi:hydroxyacyl-ACP dehydratase HTD2-like protein with hotdog domain